MLTWIDRLHYRDVTVAYLFWCMCLPLGQKLSRKYFIYFVYICKRKSDDVLNCTGNHKRKRIETA